MAVLHQQAVHAQKYEEVRWQNKRNDIVRRFAETMIYQEVDEPEGELGSTGPEIPVFSDSFEIG